MAKSIFDGIVKELQGGPQKNAPSRLQENRIDFTPSTTKEGLQIVRPVDYVVPVTAIYDRLSDGTYTPKFENYLGATGNEDRLAAQQSTSEQAWNGALKNSRKMGNYILDTTVGTVYGLYKGLSSGDMNQVFNNDFASTLDDWNKQLDYKLPNYYSDEQKSKGFLASLGDANFWFNDVAGGLAFVGGALIPELILGVVTGGATLPGSIAKAGLKFGLKKLSKEGLEIASKELVDPTNINKVAKSLDVANDGVRMSKAKDTIRGYNRALFGEKVGSALSTGRFLLQSSNFEAGMEARQNFKESITNFYDQFEQEQGRQPSHQEAVDFMNDARSVSNGVYGANLAILSISNAAMFGKAFDINIIPGARKSVDNFFNKTIGLGIKTTEGGFKIAQKANRVQKIAGTTFKLLEKPVIEGVYEEGFQGVAGKTMQNYLEEQYSLEDNKGEGFWGSLSDSFAEQYGSKEGWKEMGIGMIIGFAGGGITRQGLPGVGRNSYKTRKAEIETGVAKVNEGLTTLQQNVHRDMADNRGVTTLRALSKASAAKKGRESVGNNFAPAVDNVRTNLHFIQSQEHLKSQNEMQKDYNLVVDKMELTSEQTDELTKQGIDLVDYKESMKNEFAQTASDYNFARKTVNALELDKNIKDSAGNIQNVGDAMVWNIMMGKSAFSNAQKVGIEIQDIIGSQGLLDHLQFYNGLEEDKKASVQQLSKLKKDAKRFQKAGVDIQNQIAGVATKRQTGAKDATLEKRFNTYSEKYLAATQSLTATNEEIAKLEEALGSDFNASKFELGEKVTGDSYTTVGQALEEVDKLDAYITSLETLGKDVEANTLKSLVSEFKVYSDAHREFVNGQRRMSATGFFKSSEGKSLLNSVLGPKYTISPEFRKIIEDNDAVIDRSLGLVGIRGHEKTSEVLEGMVENNDQLSDREKFRLESIIRLQLNMKALDSKLENMSLMQEAVNVDKTRPQGPTLEGDSVTLRVGLNIKADGLDNLDIINDTIKAITTEIDAVRKSVQNPTQATELQNQLSELKARKEEIATNTSNISTPEKTLTQLKQNLASEQNTSNRYNYLTNQEEVDKEITKVEEELSEAKKGIKIISTPEYIRLSELTKKFQNTGLSTEEYAEMEELKTDIDQWMLITGTVVEGIRLSDLVRQKVALENIKVAPLEVVEEVTEQEILDEVEFTYNTERANYNLGQTHEAVTARLDQKNKQVVISGVRPEDIPTLFSETDAEGATTPIDFEYSINPENNNILIPLGEDRANLAKVNSQNSNISVLPTNKDLVSTYSLVIVHRKNIAGENESTYLESDYKSDYTEPQNSDALYDLQTGDGLILRIDSRDKYNQSLFLAYEQAKTKKEKESMKEIMRRSLRITIFDTKGNFLATLKGKKLNTNKSPNDQKFDQFRDSIVNNEDLMEVVMGISDLHTVETAPITVKKTMIGHPNFNFKKNSDGSVSIVYKQFDDQMAQKIEDIGYVTNNTITTRSGEKGLDTTFLKKAMKNTKAKTPFVVIRKGSVRVAYPVRLIKQEQKDTTELTEIFNSKLDSVTKVVKLNEILAARGVDIKSPGNFFYAVGNTSNLTQEFFDRKVAQLNQIEYFYPLDEWIKKDIAIGEILKKQALININLSSPIHSPKVAMDFSNILPGYGGQNSVTIEDITEEDGNAIIQETKTSKNKAKSSHIASKYANLPSEKDIADSAEDEKNTDCNN